MKAKHLIISILFVTVGLSGCSEPTQTEAPPVDSPQGDAVTCVYTPDGPAAKTVELPPSTPATTGVLSATLHMEAGDVTMTLDRAKTPCAVGSFESLVKQGYFDDTKCHRLALGFVLQCGDPTATGRGGPGYSFADELTGTETYPMGTVAMANAGPDTNGSQFFIMIAEGIQLDPAYVVMGTVDKASMEVIMNGIVAGGVEDPSNAMGSPPNVGGGITSVTLN
ncbi:MAG: peptidylprolyl isomerase [Propionibacteriaceae bacterium]|jgi:peptidyl-prolyl cis-trans isomerase B (cyclophilin B)|nr:peptidylprolyl isomerase [Propionibacteriaceae bacterium]